MKIASEHKVSRKFVRKIESELYTNDGRRITKGVIIGKKGFVQRQVKGRTVARNAFEAR